MASWAEVQGAAPELAQNARRFFDATIHKTLATLRQDGSPRISGIETIWAEGELWFGSMWGARKALDLRADPRFALHSGPHDPPGWNGDAKVAGRALEVEDEERKREVFQAGGAEVPGPSHLFRCDIGELVVITIGEPGDHLVIESWHEGRGIDRIERR